MEIGIFLEAFEVGWLEVVLLPAGLRIIGSWEKEEGGNISALLYFLNCSAEVSQTQQLFVLSK